MTEYNLFCYSKEHNDGNSFQQKRYRAFNKEVSKGRYNVIRALVDKIIPNNEGLRLTDFWKSITTEQWEQLLAIPEAKDFKKGFEYISGIKINTDLVKIELGGKITYISKESAKALKELLEKEL